MFEVWLGILNRPIINMLRKIVVKGLPEFERNTSQGKNKHVELHCHPEDSMQLGNDISKQVEVNGPAPQ